MLRLKDAYRGQRAAIIMGGPSMIHSGFDFSVLKKMGFTTFLESRALTPHFMSYGYEADFYLMLFPEKCMTSSIQTFIYRGFLAGCDMRRYLKKEHHPLIEEMTRDFEKYFEVWRPHKGVHKNFKLRADSILKDCPVDHLQKLTKTKVIVNQTLKAQYLPNHRLPLELYYFDQSSASKAFSLEEYYQPVEEQGVLKLRKNEFINSAAIAFYPMLKYMGFKDVYFLGMDMSMLGALEYAAPYSFKSMLHFRWFLTVNHKVFAPGYKMNRPYYLRPRDEFAEMEKLLGGSGIRFTRVYDPYGYTQPFDQLPSISTREFLKL